MHFKLKYSSRADWFNSEPDELFHFTRLTSFKSILDSNTLRFRKNNYSNDDRDGKISDYIISVIENINTESLKDSKNWLGFSALTKANFKLYEQLNLKKHHNDHLHSMPTMYNLCFSIENNEHMWSEYGDSGNGIALVFSKSLLKRFLDYPSDDNKNKYLFCTCGKVIYDEKTKLEILEDLITNAYEDYCLKFQTEEESDVWSEFFMDLLLCSYFFKDNDWAKENEFRFILLHKSYLEPPSIDDSDNRFIEFNFNGSDNLRKYAIKKLSCKNELYVDSLAGYNIDCLLLDKETKESKKTEPEVIINYEYIKEQVSRFINDSKSNPFYNKNVVFTEKLKGSKYKEFQIIGNLGGWADEKELTIDTDYFIIADSIMKEISIDQSHPLLQELNDKFNVYSKVEKKRIRNYKYKNLQIISEEVFLNHVMRRCDEIKDTVTGKLINSLK